MTKIKKRIVDIIVLIIPMICIAAYYSNILDKERDKKELLYNYFIQSQEDKIVDKARYYRLLKDIECPQKGVNGNENEVLILALELYKDSISSYLKDDDISEKTKSIIRNSLNFVPCK
ncbi:hypothetical protein RI845_04415 [Thalassotalea nanhaiensis]|uniref:Rap1a immunity protein domain-containing protein n=1 Tax=Thalassotalea nanhaiensis TaxID=3065648 RepID=A0ABY9TKX0_9GAMM|nr:hypothetical protein RI845_04415 [Colwelliaceae bacterium SQ345]